MGDRQPGMRRDVSLHLTQSGAGFFGCLMCAKGRESRKQMNKFGHILIVEDDPMDVELTLAALEENNLANDVVVTRDGEEALDYLYCVGNSKLAETTTPQRCSSI